MKKAICSALMMCLVFAAVGYAASLTSEEEMPVWNRGEAKTDMTASLTSEEEMPVWNRGEANTDMAVALTSEEEIPVWNRAEEAPRVNPRWISQKSW
jgi:hypothetical protein